MYKIMLMGTTMFLSSCGPKVIDVPEKMGSNDSIVEVVDTSTGFITSIKPIYFHSCGWETCPYKNLPDTKWDSAVIKFVGNNTSKAYKLDILHLEHSTWSYDELQFTLHRQRLIEGFRERGVYGN